MDGVVVCGVPTTTLPIRCVPATGYVLDCMTNTVHRLLSMNAVDGPPASDLDARYSAQLSRYELPNHARTPDVIQPRSIGNKESEERVIKP